MNSKELIEILGTDSISTSRIVINHNFKRLADELENYQEYFSQGTGNETFLSVDNVVSHKNNIINFKIGGSDVEPVVTIDETGLHASTASVGDELTIETTLRTNKIQILEPSNISNDSSLEDIENLLPNLIISTEYGNNGQTGNVNIKGNVKIEGNLSVTGDAPGGSGDSFSMIHDYTNLTELYNDMEQKGYIQFYNSGNIVFMADNESPGRDNPINIPVSKLIKLVTVLDSQFNKLIQYINKPIILTGRWMKLTLDSTISSDNPGYISNGIVNGNEIVHPAFLNSSTASIYSRYFSAIKLTPIPIMWYNNVKKCWLNIEILSAPLQAATAGTESTDPGTLNPDLDGGAGAISVVDVNDRP